VIQYLLEKSKEEPFRYYVAKDKIDKKKYLRIIRMHPDDYEK